MKKTHYAIRAGKRSMVIVKTWAECSRLVTGHPGALFRGFDRESAALAWLASSPATPARKKKNAKQNPNQWNNDLYPCIERKSYRDLITGIYYKNRCVRRQGPTMTGADYKPHIGNSVPW